RGGSRCRNVHPLRSRGWCLRRSQCFWAISHLACLVSAAPHDDGGSTQSNFGNSCIPCSSAWHFSLFFAGSLGPFSGLRPYPHPCPLSAKSQCKGTPAY